MPVVGATCPHQQEAETWRPPRSLATLEHLHIGGGHLDFAGSKGLVFCLKMLPLHLWQVYYTNWGRITWDLCKLLNWLNPQKFLVRKLWKKS